MAAALSYGYGAALVAGGMAGAAKGSMASLYAGAGSGLTIIALEYLSKSSAGPLTAVQALISVGLAYMMYNRYSESGKVMPAGMVAALSAGAVLLYVTRLTGGGAAKTHGA